MSGFEAARGAMESGLSASPDSNQESVETTESTQTPQDQATSQAIYELEKLGKFKFKGEEYTPDALEKAILRMKDYTGKTQSLAEERKKWEADRVQREKELEENQKYYKNLSWDLQKVRENPNLATEFIKVYPEAFHKDLKEVLAELDKTQSPSPQARVAAVPDIDLHNKVGQLEKYIAEQETAKHEAEIKSIVSEMSQKYPDAMKDLVLARAHEAADGGVKLSKEVWEKLFKESHDQVNAMLKARYGEMVKNQTVANSKSRDVGSGGGTPGQAPKKFSSFAELNKHAIPAIIGKES